MNRVKDFFRDLQIKLLLAVQQMSARFADERGDTNFISIAIILVVVIGIAVVFITLGDTIEEAFTKIVEKLKEMLKI